jgi:hypothetical protein
MGRAPLIAGAPFLGIVFNAAPQARSHRKAGDPRAEIEEGKGGLAWI